MPTSTRAVDFTPCKNWSTVCALTQPLNQKETAMTKQLHEAFVAAPAKEADDTNVPNVNNEHAPAVNSSVEYINNVVRTEEPEKITDVVFFGIVKSW